MKILFSLLISIMMLNAYDFNTSKLDTSIVSKWQDVDSKLQQFIIQEDKQGMKKKFFSLLKQPFSVLSDEEKANFQIPRINYTHNDIRVLLSYTKYLIDQKRTQEIAKIYTEAIDGLNHSEDGYSAITIIFKIVVNRTILKSLEYDLAYLDKKDKAMLLSKVPNLFELKLEDFDTTFKNNTKSVIQEYKSTFIKMLPSDRSEQIASKIEEKVSNFYNHLFTSKSIEENNQVISKFEKDGKIFINKNLMQVSFLNQELIKYANSKYSYLYLDNFNLPKVTTAQSLSDEIIIDTFFYRAFSMSIYKIREDCKKVIELNKKVLEMLNK